MTSPLIAVVSYHLAEGRISKWDTGGFAVPDDYVAALDRAGGRAALLTGPSKEDASELLARFDGLLLVGGGDVAPERYGTDRHHPDLYGVDPDRDDIELELTLAANALRVPTLAVCRGAQVVNVAFGGSLHQHLPELPEFDHRLPAKVGFIHEVKVAESSRLAEATGAAALRCYSAHHQGLDRLGEGLTAVGWAEDGLIEAVERPDGWMVGVQWHPERTAHDDPAQQALFDQLVVRAGTRASG